MNNRLLSNIAVVLLGVAALWACSSKKEAHDDPHKAGPPPYRAAGDSTCDEYIATMLRCAETKVPEASRGHALRALRSSVDSMLSSVVDLRSGDSALGSMCDTFNEMHKDELSAMGCASSVDDLREVITAGGRTDPTGVPACDDYVASQRKCIDGSVGHALHARFSDDVEVGRYQKQMTYYLNVWADLMRRDVQSKRAYDFADECEGLADIAKKHGGCRE